MTSVADEQVLASFELHMMTAKFSPVTITDRLELIRRLARALPAGLLAATPADLERFQQSFATLSRNSVNIYTRHIQAFYRWAVAVGLIESDPCGRLVAIRQRKGLPHPITEKDLRTLLACATGSLRTTYVLAAFAGLRAGEICRLRGEDLTLDADQPTALIDGKGGKERIVPLLPPVVEELRRLGFPRSGHVITCAARGGPERPYTPERLSQASTVFMRSVGVKSTLHSLRHYFATEVVKLTRDILLVRDLLGHASLATTQIYMHSTLEGATERMASFASTASTLLADGAAGEVSR